MKKSRSQFSSKSPLSFWSAAMVVTSLVAVGCASGDGDDDEGDTMGDGDGDTSGDGDGDGDITGDGDGDGDLGGAAGDGDGDVSPPPSVCDGATSAPVTADVSDLETDATGWDIYASTEADDRDNGAELTAPDSDSFEDPPAVVEDGADGTAQSLQFAGTGWATYGAGLNYNLEGCKDLTAYTGVKFWIKGSTSPDEGQETPPGVMDNTVNFRVITAGSHSIINEGGVNVGGDCDVEEGDTCFMPPQLNIPVTGTWEEIEVPFDDLVTPAGANPGSAFSGTNAMLLGWHAEGANFDIQIDEVSFY